MEPSHTYCSLLLPDASSLTVATGSPIGVEAYVGAAVQFVAWAFKTPGERAEVLRTLARVQAEADAAARMATICEWAASGQVPEAAAHAVGGGDAPSPSSRHGSAAGAPPAPRPAYSGPAAASAAARIARAVAEDDLLAGVGDRQSAVEQLLRRNRELLANM
jgi:hypothetical protein